MVIIQNAINDASVDECEFKKALQQTLEVLNKGTIELLIRIVDTDEIKALNNTYRQQNKATNVLSFSSDLPAEIDEYILGDVVICTKVVKAESITQGKTFKNHLIHIAVHGVLHLLGYNHTCVKDAKCMESLEVKILASMKIANPYE